MYLPLAALLALIVVVVARMIERVPSARTRQRVAVIATATASASLMLTTVARNREYATGLEIWQSVVNRHPTGRAHYNLGLELKAAGRRDDAIAEYRLALDTSPDAHYALAFELAADGRHQEAADHYRTFIRLKPRDANVPRAYHQLGRSLMALGQRAEAATAFREVLARKAGDPDAMGGLADTLLAMERWADAVTVYADYLRIKPSDPTHVSTWGSRL